MKSLNAKINQLAGLLGTKDVSEWENDFIDSIICKTGNGSRVNELTSKQVEIVERIHSKHYSQD
ncbi:MAG TPA: hypothetical protein VGD04_10285 [Methylophilus sp.]